MSCTQFHRITDYVIECTMPAITQAHGDSVSVCVEFENLPCQRADLATVYTYKKNPTIFFIKPTKSYLRYGRTTSIKTAIHTGFHAATAGRNPHSDVLLMCSVSLLLSFQ